MFNKLFSVLSILIFTTVAQAAPMTFSVIGDSGKVTKNAKLVRDSMVRKKVFSTVIPGDNLYSNQTYDGVWTAWRNLGITFDVVAIGNHHDGYLNEMSYFQMPAEYYVKVINGVKFLVLNSDNTATVAQQTSWLDIELNRTTEKLVFLVYHHPSYTISGFHSWGEKKKFQQALRPLIWKHRSKLTALIVGHDHIASLIHFNDLPVIVSGAVMEVRGADPRNYVEKDKYSKKDVVVKTAWHFDNKKPFWAKLTVDGVTNKASVDYIRAHDDFVGCTATLETGKAAQLASNCKSLVNLKR